MVIVIHNRGEAQALSRMILNYGATSNETGEHVLKLKDQRGHLRAVLRYQTGNSGNVEIEFAVPDGE